MGDEQVTLATLREYLKSGEAFLRRADGTLLAVENREDLERFVRMLESFRAREEGGFEGKLHTAAELQYVMTSSKHYNSARTESFAQFTKALERGKPVKKAKIPARLARVLRDYQKDGINWMYFLRSYRFAGILADDMGLGKTLQTLSLLSLERVPGRPSLVVCPKTLLYNWKNEAAQFTPDMKVAVIDGTPSEREEVIRKSLEYDLIITSYSAIKKDAERYEREGLRFNYCVLDEAQFIKNHATKNAQIVKKIPSDYRLALTGTPLENSVSEIWSVFDFLMPGFLGSYESFSKHFHKPIMDAGDRNALEQLRRKISCFMLRRTKGEVLGELPPKIEQESRCHLDPAQNILYQEILTKVRRDIFSTVEQQGFSKSQIHILSGLTKLRQVCNHPALLLKPKDHRVYESAKLAMCMELVEEIVSGKRKVLIFSQFTQMLDIVAKELGDRDIAHCYLSGKTKDRQKVVDEFNTDPAIPVFLISLKAGGTGLNLTSADTVIIFDPWWNPSVENQAIDRAHRIGQRQSVNVYRLITEGTIEEKIQALQKKKKNLFDALIDESADLFKKLTWDDVKALFR
jgi:SNF2 family DNA or RNA helicase